jgi:hypothetical protein
MFLINNDFNYFFLKNNYFLSEKIKWGLGIGDGDWGLGIGDWAQSPIPNPQSPIPNPHFIFSLKK